MFMRQVPKSSFHYQIKLKKNLKPDIKLQLKNMQQLNDTDCLCRDISKEVNLNGKYKVRIIIVNLIELLVYQLYCNLLYE